MTQTKTLIHSTLLCIGWFGAVGSLAAQPEAPNPKNAFKFDRAIELPGITLPAGSYVIRLKGPALDKAPAGSNLIEILSPDTSRIYATIRSIREFRAPVAGEPLFTFYEAPGGRRLALKAWWPPPNPYPYQEQFIYPTDQALELMRATKDEVLYLRPNVSGGGTTLSMVVPVPAPPVLPSGERSRTAARPAAEMPKTASDLPLLLLMGALWCAGGLAIRAFSILLTQRPRLAPAGRAASALLSGEPVSIRIIYRGSLRR